MTKKEDALNKELDLNEEEQIREHIKSWKEEVINELNEEFDNEKQKLIGVLEEENMKYQEELKEEFADKMMLALNEMRDEIKAEVISEMVSSNPELQILEKIKELVAPTLNESYGGNLYAEELALLREENLKIKREMSLEEGARTLAKLLSDYDKKTQRLIITLVNEGSAEEVTEQFYNIIESLSEGAEDDNEGDDDEEVTKKTYSKKTDDKKKKDDKDDEEDEDEDEEADDEEADDEDEDEEDTDEDEEDEDEEKGKGVVKESVKGEDAPKAKVNHLKNKMKSYLTN